MLHKKENDIVRMPVDCPQLVETDTAWQPRHMFVRMPDLQRGQISNEEDAKKAQDRALRDDETFRILQQLHIEYTTLLNQLARIPAAPPGSIQQQITRMRRLRSRIKSSDKPSTDRPILHGLWMRVISAVDGKLKSLDG